MFISPTKSAINFFLLFFLIGTAEATSLSRDQVDRMQSSSLEDILCLERSATRAQTLPAQEFRDWNGDLLFEPLTTDANAGTSHPSSGGSDTTKVVYDKVDVAPLPIGGMARWNSYLATNLTYPTSARRKGVEGTVVVGFVVNTDGSVSDIEIKKGIGAGCDEEAIRIVKGSPKWSPGILGGKAVRARVLFPLTFKLDGPDTSADSTKAAPPVTDGPEPSLQDTEEVYDLVDTPPSPIGGMATWQRHLSENLKYPTSARSRGIQGTVWVSFVVHTDGSIQEVTLVQGIGGGCDEEALRVFKISPKWTPGMIKGKAVRTRMTLPLSFRLG